MCESGSWLGKTRLLQSPEVLDEGCQQEIHFHDKV